MKTFSSPAGSSSLRGLPMKNLQKMFVDGKPKQTKPTEQFKDQETKSNLDLMKQMGGWVYIMCSNNHSTLYVGVTSNIASRVYEHKNKMYPKSFSATYNCLKLVYYRRFELIVEAIAEEKRIKAGSRKKKEELINGINTEWKDLYDEVKYL